MGQIKKQVPKNFVLSVAGFLINFFVGIWLVPYLVKHLGAAAYGFIPLTAVFTQYVSFFTNAIVVSVSRFLSIQIQKSEIDNAIKIYSTALMLLGGIVIVLFPAFTYVAYKIDALINIPSELIKDCIALFFYSFLAFLINLFGSVYKIPLYANNRLDRIKIIDIIRIATRLLVIILLFIVFGPKLQFVGIASLVASIIVLMCSYYLGNKEYSELVFRPDAFSKKWTKKLLSFGGWTFVHQGGDLLIFNVDVLIVNLLIGSLAAGEYGTILTWGNLLKAVSVTFSGLFGPVILIYFAHEQKDKILKVCRLGVKVLNLTLGTIIAILCGLSVPLLIHWLGEEFQHLSSVLIIKILPLSFTFAIGSLFAVFRAYNKIKVPALVTIILGVLDVILALAFVKILAWGIVGVAVANGIVVLLQGAVFAPYYAAHVLGQNKLYFFKDLIIGTCYLFSMFFLIKLTYEYLALESLFSVIVLGAVFALLGFIVFWLILLHKRDREELVNMLPAKLRTFRLLRI
ncbi:oligosaccharide flippase family protein [Carboxylicivirga taeanensis]|uniref:oligosaccharide flippase family protein n=1 Tax=Carboxylicivirga taeanensis TaxID=1416875 RepID=UPI003F6E424C